MLKDDPVVERVRAVGRAIAETCGFDPHALGEWLRKAQAGHPERIVGYETDRPGKAEPATTAGDDAVVERVRAVRRQIVEECGGDIHALFERARKIEAEHPERVRGYETDRKRRPE
jgi:hypothetical protein